jgi:hypothetical protein
VLARSALLGNELNLTTFALLMHVLPERSLTKRVNAANAMITNSLIVPRRSATDPLVRALQLHKRMAAAETALSIQGSSLMVPVDLIFARTMKSF